MMGRPKVVEEVGGGSFVLGLSRFLITIFKSMNASKRNDGTHVYEPSCLLLQISLPYESKVGIRRKRRKGRTASRKTVGSKSTIYNKCARLYLYNLPFVDDACSRC